MTFRRGRPTRGRPFVVVVALLLVSCSSASHPTARRPTTTTPSTVQPTTTTIPAAMPVTVSALVGPWRAVSITGYTGPGGETLRFDGQDTWQGSDGCNDTYGTYRFGPTGTFNLTGGQTTAVGCVYARTHAHPTGGEAQTPPFPFAAVRVELLNSRLTFFARNGNQLAQYERTTDPRCTPTQLSATFGFLNNSQAGPVVSSSPITPSRRAHWRVAPTCASSTAAART